MDPETQPKRPRRQSGADNRKQKIESLALQISQGNYLFEETQRSFQRERNLVRVAQEQLEQFKRDLKNKQQRMREKQMQYIKESNQINKCKIELNQLLCIDDIKSKVQKQKNNDAVQKKHDKRGGKKIDLSNLDKLPLEIALYIGEFLTCDVRIQYLEAAYKPLPILNKLNITVKRHFFTLALMNKKYFSHLSKEKIKESDRKIHFAGCNTINDEIYSLIHHAKQENPRGAYLLLRAMCIIFKKGKKYYSNWHTFHAIRTRLIVEGN